MEIEVLQLDFNFPRNLSELPEQEKEELRVRHLRHVSSAQALIRSSELSPSRTIEPGDDQWLREQGRRRRRTVEIGESRGSPIEEAAGAGGTFVDGVGWVVEGEDPAILMSAVSGRSMSREDAIRLVASATGAARAVSDKDVVDAERAEFRDRLARMSPLEQDVELRFGDM